MFEYFKIFSSYVVNMLDLRFSRLLNTRKIHPFNSSDLALNTLLQIDCYLLLLLFGPHDDLAIRSRQKHTKMRLTYENSSCVNLNLKP